MNSYPELPFFDDPTALFECLAEAAHPVLLDSGGGDGQWDIVAADPDPRYSLMVEGDCNDGVLKSQLRDWQGRTEALRRHSKRHDAKHDGAPFRGGCIGVLSYELGRRLHGLQPSPSAQQPLAVAHYYPWAIVQDRQRRRAWLASVDPLPAKTTARVRELLSAGGRRSGAVFHLDAPFEGPWDLESYRGVFDRVKDYIRAGDCYQINLGQPFSAPYRGALLGVYRQLREIAKAPFSALFPCPMARPCSPFHRSVFLPWMTCRLRRAPSKERGRDIGTRRRTGQPRRRSWRRQRNAPKIS